MPSCWQARRRNSHRTTAWGNAQDKHLDVLHAQKPKVWIGKKPEQYNPQVQAILGGDVFVGNVAHLLAPWAQYTTGGATLCWLAHEAPEAEFHVFGFNLEDEPGWARYIETDAKHYAHVAPAERRAVRDAVARLESLYRSPAPYTPKAPAVVVPVKGVSLGAPGKNAVLLPRVLWKLEGRDVTVLTDSAELSSLARASRVKTYMLPTIQPYADVTDSLRQ